MEKEDNSILVFYLVSIIIISPLFVSSIKHLIDGGNTLHQIYYSFAMFLFGMFIFVVFLLIKDGIRESDKIINHNQKVIEKFMSSLGTLTCQYLWLKQDIEDFYPDWNIKQAMKYFFL